ncbi:uncharacterized protein NMK_1844 [Novimethylophilus kurashikiensis]|uniref:Uncharacterized protein n=1 Tax=Novimethylophilus kurashikiensis TaxID=1825523 RepID=A0A2R5F9Q8_9PROT|nr:hypothetical protein [Novimethylophilus kurashikiensis]GBG14278.1 uncharacterized protein NMK_1844 [Novimethylophilus kurashikiensis]
MEQAATRAGNIRHNLDEGLIQAQTKENVTRLEGRRGELKSLEANKLIEYKKALDDGNAHLWSKVPKGDSWVDPYIDNEIERHLNYYSKARVLELPIQGNRFILVYGDAADDSFTNGTGPFESFEKAASWFNNGGR